MSFCGSVVYTDSSLQTLQLQFSDAVLQNVIIIIFLTICILLFVLAKRGPNKSLAMA